MNKVTPEQKQKICELCERYEDMGWDYIAAVVNETLGIKVTGNDVFMLYIVGIC